MFSFVNYLLVLDRIQVVGMFKDYGKVVKLSLRTNYPYIDVGEIAMALGGGGHNHSAAAIIKKSTSFDQTVNEVLEKLKTILTVILKKDC